MSLSQPSGAGGEGQVRESAQTNYISTERKDREVVLGRSRVVNGIEVEESEGVYRLMLSVLCSVVVGDVLIPTLRGRGRGTRTNYLEVKSTEEHRVRR